MYLFAGTFLMVAIPLEISVVGFNIKQKLMPILVNHSKICEMHHLYKNIKLLE